MKSLNVQSLALVLCILCSVCVAPVMAGNEKYIIEDGVHLIKSDDSPTRLDQLFYHIESSADVVVDGNQFYWVRIGSVKAAEVSSNMVALLLCEGIVVIGAAGVAYFAAPAVVGGSAAGGASTVAVESYTISSASVSAIVGGLIVFAGDKLSAGCNHVEKLFVVNQFRDVASDGTILLGIKKTNTAGIRELKNSGIDNKLTHLSIEGKVVKTDL